MNAHHQLHLEDAQKKLSAFKKHLDLLARCKDESNNVDPSEVLSAVSELESLVEWAAQQPDLGAESAVLLVKLQELHQIREDLEKNSTEENECSNSIINFSEESLIPEKPDDYSKKLDYTSVSAASNLCNNNEDNYEDDSISMDKDSLGEYSVSTEDPYVANAESPQSIDDANVEIIPNDDKIDHTEGTDEIDDLHLKYEQNDNERSKEVSQENREVEKNIEKNETESLDSQCQENQKVEETSANEEAEFLESDKKNENSQEPLEINIVEIQKPQIEDYEKNEEKFEGNETQNIELQPQENQSVQEIIEENKEQVLESQLRQSQKILEENEMKNLESLSQQSQKIEETLEASKAETVNSQSQESEKVEATPEDSKPRVLNLQPHENEESEGNPQENEKPGDILQEKEKPGDILQEKEKPGDISQEKEKPGDIPQEKEKPGDIPQENEKPGDIPQENKLQISDSQSSRPEVNSPNLYRSDVIIIETDEENHSTEQVIDSKSSNDPLDVCMYAIRNLYESLRVKENELLKLSAMQNDQKHIEALQAVIIEFHKDITNLNTELEKSRKENLSLKEQVLELEEAENDARLAAQKLQQKLIFLQEKDSHAQAEISQLKQCLKKNTELLAGKDATEKELRSQIKYLDTLAQKYEDQIKTMEAKETDTSKKLEDLKEEVNSEKKTEEKPNICSRGTQTYDPPKAKIHSSRPSLAESNNGDSNLSINENDSASQEDSKENTDENDTSVSTDPLTSGPSEVNREEASFTNIENISQKELLKRLHKLIDEDVSLQQQIHYLDEINLAMWKKLQNLDTHIGECKRQNINETNIAVSEAESSNGTTETSEAEIQESNNVITNQDIPEEQTSYIDQNEQYIQERLKKLEEINASFEKELNTRENLYKEKEKKYEEWMETEERIVKDLNRLTEEKKWISEQISQLNSQQEVRQATIAHFEEEIAAARDKKRAEITKIKSEQGKTTEPLNLKVNEMLTKEKDILKMITNLKSEKNRSQSKSELERLKCKYIELQLELSQVREDIGKVEDQFKPQLDQRESKHVLEESQRTSELERIRNEYSRNDRMIKNLKAKQKELASALEKQENYLQKTRESYKKNLEQKEEEHRSVETELKSQLQKIEEGTAVATTALMEERMKVEKELQGNIKDLKAKEEVYKAKISELELDVSHLHEELHKIAVDSQSKTEVVQRIQETDTMRINGKIPDIPYSKASHEVVTHAPLSKTGEGSLTVPQKNNNKELNLPVKPEKRNSYEEKSKKQNRKDTTQENVDELRAQVRGLQSELEKISREEIPPIQPIKPITAKSLKMQKVEDLDYAEVDECSFDAWKKNVPNMSVSASTPPSVQAVYGDKYSTGFKDKMQNQRAAAKESIENDYDEVLPRPTNFHVVQQVGPDTLLVGWNYVNPSVLDGFEVYLDDQVHERIYIPDRTKALISGLNLRKSLRLSICALSRYGQMSEPAVLELSVSQEINSQYFEDEDEYRDIEDPTKKSQRPYSMEW